jgi:hypothetical protein
LCQQAERPVQQPVVQPVEQQQGPQAERQQARLERLVARPSMRQVDVLLVQPPGVLVEQPRAKLDRDWLPALPVDLQSVEFFSSHHQRQQAHLRGQLVRRPAREVRASQQPEVPTGMEGQLWPVMRRLVEKQQQALGLPAEQAMPQPKVMTAVGRLGLEQRGFERRGLERLGLEQQQVFESP